MAAAAMASREQTLAGALALVTHVLFLVLIVFGVSWQHRQTENAMVAELWQDLPAVAPPKVEPPPPPAPKVENKPPPPKPAPAPKPDIALKEKQEKERKLKEQAAAEEKKREAAEKAREAAEKKKRAEAEALKKKQEAEAAEARRLVDEQERMRAAAAAQQAAATAREIDKYKRLIRDRIKTNIPPNINVNSNAEVEFEIVVLPGGDVLSVRLKRSSNSIPAYDSAVERAILKAQPLPLPPDPALMRQFRELNLVFRPDK